MAAALLANPQALGALNTVAGAASSMQQATGMGVEQKTAAPQEDQGILARMNPLNLCREAPPDVEEEDQGDEVFQPPADLSTYTLRMCVHSGTNVPDTYRTYVSVVLDESTPKEIKIPGPTVEESPAPVWEFAFDQEIEVQGGAPQCEIQVWGARHLIGDTLLCAGKLVLPTTPTNGPKRQLVKCRQFRPIAEKLGMAPTESMLMVVWEFTDFNTGEPDLIRVAEMPDTAMQRLDYHLDLSVIRLKLRRNSKPAQLKLVVQLKTLAEKMKNQQMTAAAGIKTPYKEGICEWKDANGSGNWSMEPVMIRESQVNLLSYLLVVQLHKQMDAQRWEKIGVYEEMIGDVMDSIEEADTSLYFDGEVTAPDGQQLGHLRLAVDVWAGTPHRKPPTTTAKERKGCALYRGKGKKNVTFYATCFADSIPTHSTTVDPYVQVRMGSSKGCTETLTGRFNNALFSNPVKVTTTISDRKAQVELWDGQKILGLVSAGTGSQLGEAVIYNVQPDKMFWCHLYGGALGSERSEASLMMKGAIKPASTYHGTVGVWFGTRAKPPNDVIKGMQQNFQKMKLVVRLHRGLYLDKLKGKNVNLIVQVAGCRLDVDPAALAHHEDEDEAAKKEREDQDSRLAARERFNDSLLSFPAKVDQDGIMRFHSDLRKGILDVVSSRSSAGYSWVQRVTNQRLKVREGVTYAYVYLVPTGDEDVPPELFTRIRLQKDPGEYPSGTTREQWISDALSRTSWKRVRIDTSVTDLPESTYRDDHGGSLLCSAVLVKEPKDNPLQMEEFQAGDSEVKVISQGDHTVPTPMMPSSVMCRPWMPDSYRYMGSIGDPRLNVGRGFYEKKTLYCHIDVLAARTLKATDEDGLCDPCYTVRIGALEVKSWEAFEVAKTLEPTFNHRLVIPVEVEIGPGMLDSSGKLAEPQDDDRKVQTPPIVFTLYDQDPGKYWGSLTTERMEIGKAVIKHPTLIDARPGGITRDGCANTNDPNVHRAFWYALDRPEKARWDPANGGVDPSFRQRPRVLIAAGFSTVQKVEHSTEEISDPTQVQMYPYVTREFLELDVELSMLGLRNLHVHSGVMDFSIDRPDKLKITSCFGHTIPLLVGPGVNPNFETDKTDSNYPRFKEDVKAMIRIKDKPSDMLADASVELRPHLEGAEAEDEESEDDDESVATSVEVESFVGVKLSASMSVNIVPYLQQENTLKGPVDKKVEYSGDWLHKLEKQLADEYQLTTRSMCRRLLQVTDQLGQPVVLFSKINRESVDKARFPLTIKDQRPDPLVLMPDLVFQLVSSLGRDYGTMMYPMPGPPLESETHLRKSWNAICLDEQASLPTQLKDVSPLKNNVVIDEEAYRCFVDVFAAKQGYLLWDEDFQLGRALNSQQLFEISNQPKKQKVVKDDTMDDSDSSDSDDDDDKPVIINQFFNPADYFLGDLDRLDEPFDDRVTPLLRCANWDPGAGHYVPTVPRNSMPLGRKAVFANYFKERVPTGAATAKAAAAKAKAGAKQSLSKKKLDARTLMQINTKDLRWTLHAQGYRCLSHLHVPEYIADPVDPEFSKQDMSDNLRTFMRPVGHFIDPRDRDSTFLCRLRMTLPSPDPDVPQTTEETARRREYQENMCNIFVVQFTKPGRIIWVAPESTTVWRTAGKLLFAVRLQGQTDVVPVTVPNFDLRFPYETNWTPVKTLLARSRTLETRFQEQQQAKAPPPQPEAATGGGEAGAKAETASKAPIAAQKADAAHAGKGSKKPVDGHPIKKGKPTPPDGIGKAIPVHQYAFVCRLAKRGGHCYDREQSSNWYRTALQQIFPEVKRLEEDKEDDKGHVKEMFFSRFMNIRKALSLGEEGKDQGLVKGHVNVSKKTKAAVATRDKRQLSVSHSRLEPPEPPKKTRPKGILDLFRGQAEALGGAVLSTFGGGDEIKLYRPMESLWLVTQISVNIYILTANELKLNSLGTGEFNPYLKVGIKEEEMQETDPLEALDKNRATATVPFYKQFSLDAEVPGDSKLSIKLYDQVNLGSDKLVGSVDLDIEDRFLCLGRRLRRSVTNQAYLESQVSPKEEICVVVPATTAAQKAEEELKQPPQPGRQKYWMDASDPQIVPAGAGVGSATGSPARAGSSSGSKQIKIKPRLAPPDRLPVEIVDLLNIDEDTGVETKVGVLRLWVDLTPVSEKYAKANLGHPSYTFQVRIVIKSVKQIMVWQDAGQRNDVYIDAKLKTRDLLGKTTVQAKQTDIHKWSHSEADFNWAMTFEVTAPNNGSTLELGIMDYDRMFGDDAIYDTKPYPLDQFLSLAMIKVEEGEPPLGVLNEVVLFDSWPTKKKGKDKCCKCWKTCCKCLAACYACFCCCCKKRSKILPAMLHMSVQVLPLSDATLDPLQDGRPGAEPPTRMGWSTAVRDPQKFCFVLLGPANTRSLCICGVCSFIVLIVMLILAGFFFGSQGINGVTR